MIPNDTKKQLFDGQIDLVDDTLRVLLLKDTTAYSPDPDRDATVADILSVADEFDDTNYSRQDLSAQTTATDDTNDKATFDAGDTTFPSLGSDTNGQVVQTVVVYKQVGGDDTTSGDDSVVQVFDDSTVSGLPKQTNGDDFTVRWDDIGLLELTG